MITGGWERRTVHIFPLDFIKIFLSLYDLEQGSQTQMALGPHRTKTTARGPHETYFSCWRATLESEYLFQKKRSDTSNTWPAGRMRPARWFNAARGQLLKKISTFII